MYMDGDPDVWVRTGDEVMFNEKMEVFVLDRIKVKNFRSILENIVLLRILGNYESQRFPR